MEYNIEKIKGVIPIQTVINDLKINYIKKGESSQNVLILPGWGTTINTYIPLINGISTYANVYSLDMPGFGQSEEPKESWNLDKYVDFVIEFIEEQNIKNLDLIGHSNGGRIIIKLMTRRDLKFKVNKVILIGSAGIVHPKSTTRKIKENIFKITKKILELKPFKKVFAKFIIKFQNKFGSEDYRNASPIMKKTMVKLLNEDVRECLPNINVPTLLIWGENDTATPISDAEIMEKTIPDAGLVRIKGCTHYVFLENTQYVNKIIENFLNEKDN